MRTDKLDPYRSQLSAFQISAGLRAVKANAASLVGDATVLMDAGRYPRGCALGVLAIEEFGKLAVLRRMALAESPAQWRTCWRDFADHLAKSPHWLVPYLVGHVREPAQFIAQFHANKDPEVLNSLKQIGLYVGCYASAHWSLPEDVIDRDVAATVMYAAHVLQVGSQTSPLDMPEAVKLWAEAMGGCFMCDGVTANNRVVDFLSSARSNGIKLAGEGIPPSVAFEFMSTVVYLGAGPDEEE